MNIVSVRTVSAGICHFTFVLNGVSHKGASLHSFRLK